MYLKVKITEDMAKLDADKIASFNLSVIDLENFKPQIINFSQQIREKVDQNIKRILKDISKTLNSYSWHVVIDFNLEIIQDKPCYKTRIIMFSEDYKSIRGELVAEVSDYLQSNCNSSMTISRKGSLNFLKVNDKSIDLDFNTIENRNLKYRLILGIPHKDMSERVFKNNNYELDIIDSKIREFFRTLKDNELKHFWYMHPEILVSDIIVWKFYAFSRNVFNGCNIYFSQKDNTLLECNNAEFLREIVNASEAMDEYAIEFDSTVELCNKLRKIGFREDMTEEESIELIKYIKLLDY